MATDVLRQLLLGPDPGTLHRAVLAHCLTAMQASRASGQLGRILWIVPSQRAQRLWSSQLVAQMPSVCLAPPLVTFDRFAERLLRAGGHPATQLSSTVRRMLLRRITSQLLAEQRLVHFAGVAHTSGFLDVVSGFIADIKRDEVWPEEFLNACQKSSLSTQRDRELGLIYQRYQNLLLAHDWYDAEGRYWLARTMLTEKACPELSEWDWIGVSGFSDFTRTQYEILEHLARTCPSFLITLPGSSDHESLELYAKSQIAATTLCTQIPHLQTRHIAAANTGSAARRVICESLFRNPRTITPAGDASGLQIVACVGNESEYSAVALRIKDLLNNGTRPQDIAIGLRQFQEYGRRWQAELSAAGLPIWSEAGQPLSETGLVKLILAIIQNELDDWKFDRLMAVLGSSIIQPPNYPGQFRIDVRATDRVLRGLRLSQGRHEILTQIERALSRMAPDIAAVDLDDADIARERPLTVAEYQAAQRCLSWLEDTTEAFSRSHTFSEWIAVLDSILANTGAIDHPPTDPSPATSPRDLWQRWQSSLRDAALAESRCLGQPPRRALAEFVVELRDYLAHEQLDPAPEPAGAIRILALDQLRHLEVPYVFLVSLTEDSFPRRHQDDCLFTDAERRHFVDLGVPLRHAQRHQQEELLFFASALLTATQQLTLTYSAVDSRGQPQFPSPYVTALQSLWQAGHCPTKMFGQLDPVPTEETAVTTADARLLAMQRALQGEHGWLKTLAANWPTQQLESRTLAVVQMAEARFETAGFTRYEGRLELPQHITELGHHFHRDRQFSATELEAYASCPFRYWLDHVLGAEPLPTVESGTDHMRRGVIVHDVLSQLVEQFQAPNATQLLRERFTSLVSQHLHRQPSASDLDRVLLQIEELMLTEWAGAYAEQCEHYTLQVSEAWDVTTRWETSSEVPFGKVPFQQPETSYPALAIGHGERRVLLRGRIDRIDVGRQSGKPVFTIIDYKTGRRPDAKEADLQSGRRLQLVLYAVAARRLGLVPADASPFQLGYWCIKDTGFRSGLPGRQTKFQAIEQAAWQALEDIVDETIPQLVAGLRGGEFVVENSDDHCTGSCPYHTVCRVNQIRPIAERLVKLRRSFAHPDESLSNPSPTSSAAESEVPTKKPRSRRSTKPKDDPS